MKKIKNFSEDELKSIVRNSYSYTEVSKKLGYKNIRASVQDMIEEYGFDTSHFKGHAWNKNNFNYDSFKKGSVISSARALKPLTFKRGYKCECCGLSTWRDQPIRLEIHHIDGDKLNNEESNLSILCPNCHALTTNYRGKNIDKKDICYITDEKFKDALINYPNIRQALIALGLTAKGGNYTRAREIAVKYNIKHILEP